MTDAEPNGENLNDRYERILKNCIFSFMRNLQYGRRSLIGVNFLKTQWGQNWIKEKAPYEVITMQSGVARDTYSKKRSQGVSALLNFFQIIEDKDVYPILIRKQYRIEFDDEYCITGMFDIVMEDKTRNVLQVVKIRAEGNRFNIKEQAVFDLDLNFAYYALRVLFKGVREYSGIELVIWDIERKIEYVCVPVEQYDAIMLKTIESALECMNQELYLTCPDKKCFHCNKRDRCMKHVLSHPPLEIRSRAEIEEERQKPQA